MQQCRNRIVRILAEFSATLCLAFLLLTAFSPAAFSQAENSSELPPNPEALYYGVAVSPYNIPIAELGIYYSNGNAILCSGVVLNKQTVLTAAHCLAGGPISKIVVLAGGYPAYGVLYGIDAYYIPGVASDLGYVKLDRKLPRSVKTAKISKRPPSYGEPLYIFGFGDDEYGSKGVLKVGVMQATGDDGVNISAVRPDGGSSTCRGDSGGPAFVLKKKKLYLVGVTARGPSNCQLGSFAFTTVLSPTAKSFIKLAKKKVKR